MPADDPALWARPLAIPFDHSLLGREDRGLEDRLCAELPAVLAWAVAGWDDHRQRGRLDPPAAVSEATSTYRINNDSVAEFIDDCCLLNRDGELRLFDTLPNETRREQAKSDSLGPPTAGVLYGTRRIR